MNYAPDCADCPTPAECKAASDCKVLRQIRHPARGDDKSGTPRTDACPADAIWPLARQLECDLGVATRSACRHAARANDLEATASATLPPELTPILLLNAAVCVENKIEVPQDKRDSIMAKLMRVAKALDDQPRYVHSSPVKP